MTREEQAYLKFKKLVNTYCLSKQKMTPKLKVKLDEAWNKWQAILEKKSKKS